MEEEHRGRATHFVSWCWAYSLNDFVSALQSWVVTEDVCAGEVYLWVCFFCNNQLLVSFSGKLCTAGSHSPSPSPCHPASWTLSLSLSVSLSLSLSLSLPCLDPEVSHARVRRPDWVRRADFTA